MRLHILTYVEYFSVYEVHSPTWWYVSFAAILVYSSGAEGGNH